MKKNNEEIDLNFGQYVGKTSVSIGGLDNTVEYNVSYNYSSRFKTFMWIRSEDPSVELPDEAYDDMKIQIKKVINKYKVDAGVKYSERNRIPCFLIKTTFAVNPFFKIWGF